MQSNFFFNIDLSKSCQKKVQISILLVLILRSILEIWRQISKSGSGAKFKAGFVKICTIFSRIFCLMFLIGAIKPKAENKFQTYFIFTRQFREEVT